MPIAGTPSPARWIREARQSRLREIHELISRPGILSLALGLPAQELFPTEAYTRAAVRVLGEDRSALQYGTPSARLKSHVVDLMRARGVICRQEQVFLTSGAQQGMDLLARLLLEPGGQVIVEEATFDGILLAVRPFEPRVLTVPCDPFTGMDVEALERLLGSGADPAFIYTMTEGHNPLGASLSLEKRGRLVEAARRHQVPIIEDDAYGFLTYGDAPPPALRALDDTWVFYVGSFSKILAPALRVGWIIAPAPLVQRLSTIKHGCDLDITTFAQRTVSAYLDDGALPAQIARLRSEYAARRDAMTLALSESLPSSARFHSPQAGMFVWVELEPGTNAADLLEIAVQEERVAFIPGEAFSADGGARARHCIRLSYSSLTPDLIREAVSRLGRVVAKAGERR